MEDAHTELRKFCIDKAVQTNIRDKEGNYNQAPVLDTAKQYYEWLTGQNATDKETP